MANNLSNQSQHAFDTSIDLTESTVRSLKYEFHDELGVYVIDMLVRPWWSDNDLAIRFEDVLYFELTGGDMPRIYSIIYSNDGIRVSIKAKGLGMIYSRRVQMLNAKYVFPKSMTSWTAEDFYKAIGNVSQVERMIATSTETVPEKYLDFQTVDDFIGEAIRLKQEYLADPYCPEDDLKKGVDLEQCNSMQVAMYKRMLHDRYCSDQKVLRIAMRQCAQRIYEKGLKLYADDRGPYYKTQGVLALIEAAKLFGREFVSNRARDFLARLATNAGNLSAKYGADIAEEIMLCKELSDRWRQED